MKLERKTLLAPLFGTFTSWKVVFHFLAELQMLKLLYQHFCSSCEHLLGSSCVVWQYQLLNLTYTIRYVLHFKRKLRNPCAVCASPLCVYTACLHLRCNEGNLWRSPRCPQCVCDLTTCLLWMFFWLQLRRSPELMSIAPCFSENLICFVALSFETVIMSVIVVTN